LLGTGCLKHRAYDDAAGEGQHERADEGLKAREQADMLARFEVAVSERGEGDNRKVKRIGETDIDCVFLG
jgi:hypothetical protein